MIRVPIKLYYINGVIDLESNLNETPLITRLSNLSYRLFYYDLNDEIGAVEATFQKPDGTQVQLSMVYNNTITNDFGTWQSYYCDLTNDVTSMANSLGNNNLYVSFNCYDGYSNALFNTEAFLLHCTYAINNALVEFEMTPMEYYQYQYNLALSERALASQVVLHVNSLPTPSSSNAGFVYLLEQDTIGGDYVKGDVFKSDGSYLTLLFSKPNTVNLNATSGTLNNNAYNYARRENTIIIYKSGNVVEQFYQVYQDNDEIIYRSETQIDIDTDYNSLKYSVLTITKSTKAYVIVAHNDNFYNKTESDTLLALKEDVANKATDFSVIDNTKYPTTKAVDDFFEGKIEETAYYPIIIGSATSGTFSQSRFNILTTKRNAVIVQQNSDGLTHYVCAGSSGSYTYYYGTTTKIKTTTQDMTIFYYQCQIDNNTRAYTITEISETAYRKGYVEYFVKNHLTSATTNTDVLTLTGVSNGSYATLNFDVSHKLNKDFTGENVLPQPIGQNDYFIINVSGVPYKVSWQTIYDQLGIGGLTEHFKGTYNSLSALETAYPTASAGDYAYITEIVSGDTILTMAIWDTTDSEWQVQDLSQYVSQQVFEDTVDDLQDDIDSKSSVTLVEWS